MTDTIKWRCRECGDEFETEPTRHDPSRCECGEAFVDHEEHYCRRSFEAEPIDPDRF